MCAWNGCDCDDDIKNDGEESVKKYKSDVNFSVSTIFVFDRGEL